MKVSILIGFEILGKRAHLFTFICFTFWRIYQSMEIHSGFEILYGPYKILPFVFVPDHHEFHHK